MTDKQTIKKLKAENKKLTNQILDWKFELGYFCVGKPTPKSLRKFVIKVIDQSYDFKKIFEKQMAVLRKTRRLNKHYNNSKQSKAKI